MAKKSDLRQLEAVAAELGLVGPLRHDFGDYVEELKSEGMAGSKANGDFSYAELLEIGRMFREERLGG